MIARITSGSVTYRVDLANPKDIAIPLDFHSGQPTAFGVPAATARPYEGGGFVGDTRRGGSCNFEELALVPHCNGTHTEGVGHIANQRISVHTIVKGGLYPSTLITVRPESATASRDTYDPPKKSDDMLITRRILSDRLAHTPPAFLKGLVIRTLPNDDSKKTRNYTETPPAFFSVEAMRHIVELGVEHLLVDIPSLERARDEGKLTTHRIFWGISPETHDIDSQRQSMKTVTELVYVPDDIPDGPYMVSLQIPAFVSDAAPSRPLLYAVSE